MGANGGDALPDALPPPRPRPDSCSARRTAHRWTAAGDRRRDEYRLGGRGSVALARLQRRGSRVLVVVLLRQHRERAVSAMAHRQSRMPFVASAGWLERVALRDSLTAAALGRIYALGVDVLAVRFDTLAGDPPAVLDALARLCRTRGFAAPDTRPVNQAVQASLPLLGAAAKSAAVLLRGAGARRRLQTLKDEDRVQRLFVRPAPPGRRFCLSAAAGTLLDRRFDACPAAVAAASRPLGEGLWFARRRRVRRASSDVLPLCRRARLVHSGHGRGDRPGTVLSRPQSAQHAEPDRHPAASRHHRR